VIIKILQVPALEGLPHRLEARGVRCRQIAHSTAQLDDARWHLEAHVEIVVVDE
jgi:hypothetical protein